MAAALNLVPGFSVADATDLTAQELQASNIELRARALASKIAESKLGALGSQGVPSQIVAVDKANDLTLPGNRVASVRFADRNTTP